MNIQIYSFPPDFFLALELHSLKVDCVLDYAGYTLNATENVLKACKFITVLIVAIIL